MAEPAMTPALLHEFLCWDRSALYSHSKNGLDLSLEHPGGRREDNGSLRARTAALLHGIGWSTDILLALTKQPSRPEGPVWRSGNCSLWSRRGGSCFLTPRDASECLQNSSFTLQQFIVFPALLHSWTTLPVSNKTAVFGLQSAFESLKCFPYPHILALLTHSKIMI